MAYASLYFRKISIQKKRRTKNFVIISTQKIFLCKSSSILIWSTFDTKTWKCFDSKNNYFQAFGYYWFFESKNSTKPENPQIFLIFSLWTSRSCRSPWFSIKTLFKSLLNCFFLIKNNFRWYSYTRVIFCYWTIWGYLGENWASLLLGAS